MPKMLRKYQFIVKKLFSKENFLETQSKQVPHTIDLNY